jgi:hypothetical protein
MFYDGEIVPVNAWRTNTRFDLTRHTCLELIILRTGVTCVDVGGNKDCYVTGYYY